MSFDRSTLPGPDVTDAMVVDDNGMPLAFINLPQMNSAATALAFALAASTPDTFTERFEEALERHGGEGFGYVTTAALTALVQNVVWPMIETIKETAGVDFREGLQAFADGTAPPPIEVHGVPVIMVGDETSAWAFRTLFHTASRDEIPTPSKGSVEGVDLDNTLAAYANITGKTVTEVRETSYIDCMAALSIAAVRVAAANLSIWAHENGRHDLRDPMWPADEPDAA